MDGDLSLAQSLGGLRIANPDDASPSSSPQGLGRDPSISPLSASHPAMEHGEEGSSPLSAPSLPNNGFRSTSPLGFNPKAFSTDMISAEPQPGQFEQPLASAAKDPSDYAQRHANRQSIPLTYQDQQQAKSPQYPTMMPLSQRNPTSGSRPVSSMYTQPPPVPNGNQLSRDGSYRQRDEFSRSSIPGMPQRSSSRAASTAMQAGVPTREGSHRDRSYRQSQLYNGSGGLPPRKSSRGMGGGQLGNSAVSAQSPVVGSPYGIEGGPVKSSEEWQEKGAAVGVRQEIDANGRPVIRHVKKGVKDFAFGRTLGEGSYSTVMAATDRQTGKEYAIKVLNKRHIIKEKKVKYVNIEKDTLNRLTDHPGVVRLYYTFQDEESLYFVLDLASSGELLGVLKQMTTFDEECTRFYCAEILDTIDYMHARGVIHRDLKPENVLLDDQMHVKITDFGTAKILDVPKRPPKDANGDIGAGNPLDGSEDNKANSFVGTAEYVSPELLTDKKACKSSDLWALGCIIYQLLAGRPPFKAGNEYLTFQKIVALEYQFPTGFPEVAKDLVERLLVLNPASRLSIEHIKNHEFFDGVNWGRGLWRQKAPRLKCFVPAAAEPRKLNGQGNNIGIVNNYPPNSAPSHSTSTTRFDGASSSVPRPSPRVITELPPPSQLDIEWSPVLTKNNERILKLGNLLVNTTPAPHSPTGKIGGQNGETDSPKKFSRFFSSNTPKKRQRLVMITSSARIIIVAAGGEDKKSKIEIPLLISGCSWRKLQDPKGLTYWCVDTHDKHFSFEDPKAASSDGSATSASAQEWLDSIETAREIAFSQSFSNSYTGDDVLKDLQSGSHTSSRGLDLDSPGPLENGTGRHTLQKNHSSNEDSFHGIGRKRFSKRQSKSGLAAVF
ncbi:MAG: pkb-activating kinase-like protein [Alectoria sarmentosa]|nr:MAG: pkb-activating kinase-like protein [Alectoria sarmentosa]